MDENTRADLIRLFQTHALRRGTFRLASGRTSHYYLDGRNVSLTSEGAALIGTAIYQTIRCDRINAVGGLTMGADPIVGATLVWSAPLFKDGLRGFLVRKEPKKHGTGKLIEGPLYEGDRVAILEDVTTSGGSAMQAVQAVRAAGGIVVVVVSLVDRLEGAAEYFGAQGIEFRPLLTVRDLGVEPLQSHVCATATAS